jgi:hypothetical protein
MPQSLANVLLHIVFSTKNRAPFLQDPGIREEMNGYMVGTLKAIECPSLIVRTKRRNKSRIQIGRSAR